MHHKKHYAVALLALSAFALAGCSHSSDAGGAPGPNAMDQAAAARMQSQGSPNAGAAQAAAAQAAAAHAGGAHAGGAPQTTPK